jgi:hypothetical protein
MDAQQQQQMGRLGAFGLAVQLEGSVQRLETLTARLQQVLQDDSDREAEVRTVLGELRRYLQRVDEGLLRLETVHGCAAVSEAVALRRRGAVPTDGLRGSTRAFPLADLLGLLSGQRKTGVLHLKSAEERFILEFADGAVVHAVTNTPQPEQRLGSILIAQGRIDPERLEDFLGERGSDQGPLGAALVRANLIREDDLLDALDLQIQELFRRIFELEDCQFYFAEGPVRNIRHRVCLNTIHLLLESARQQDERSAQSAIASVLRDASEEDVELAELPEPEPPEAELPEPEVGTGVHDTPFDQAEPSAADRPLPEPPEPEAAASGTAAGAPPSAAAPAPPPQGGRGRKGRRKQRLGRRG